MKAAVFVLSGLLVVGAEWCSGQPGAVATKLTFDVASVRENKSDDGRASSNVPLGPGNVYAPTGGTLTARNWPLSLYIDFAYKMTDAQQEFTKKQLPAWVQTERFDIQAKTDRPDVSKDELRLMMRELLAERFGLVVHAETREVPVYYLLPVTPGKMGPGLRVHPAKGECAEVGNDLSLAGKAETLAGGFVSYCGGITGLPAVAKGDYRVGASRVPIKLISDSLTLWGGLGKPVVDRTGLTGDYDFVLEYAPLGAPDREVEEVGPTFVEALKRQLGLQLESGKGPVELLAIDHVEHLKEN